MASASERKVGVVFLLCTLLMTSPLHSSGFIGVLIAIGAEKLGEVIVIAVVAEEAAAATAATAAAAALAAEEAAARAAAAADAALQEKLEELSESTIIGVKAEVDATLHSVVADVAATDAVARFMFSAPQAAMALERAEMDAMPSTAVLVEEVTGDGSPIATFVTAVRRLFPVDRLDEDGYATYRSKTNHAKALMMQHSADLLSGIKATAGPNAVLEVRAKSHYLAVMVQAAADETIKFCEERGASLAQELAEDLLPFLRTDCTAYFYEVEAANANSQHQNDMADQILAEHASYYISSTEWQDANDRLEERLRRILGEMCEDIEATWSYRFAAC
eukprot:jgi/Tetstr1/461544/TSEL_006650.t1